MKEFFEAAPADEVKVDVKGKAMPFLQLMDLAAQEIPNDPNYVALEEMVRRKLPIPGTVAKVLAGNYTRKVYPPKIRERSKSRGSSVAPEIMDANALIESMSTQLRAPVTQRPAMK
jgi:hypothetical protein